MNPLARPGDRIAAIDTPALVLDLDAMERNLARLAGFARERGLRLRPHAKMHKSAELARLQMAHGAVGVCVQKTAEAEALAAGGVDNIYISNEVTARPKLARVAALAQRLAQAGGRLAIAVDSAEGVSGLAQALAGAPAGSIDVFIEIDVGQARCGLPPGDAAVALARDIARHPALHLAGLQAYHGGAQHRRAPAEREAALALACDAVRRTRDALLAQGFGPLLVTGAGTGTFELEAASGLWGELQAGSYLFMDADYAANQLPPGQTPFEHALFVKSQVMSRSADRAICDAGHKTHAIESGLPTVWSPPGLVFGNGGDEHGVLRAATPGGTLPALDDTVWLIPGHCDPTVNLHDWLVGVRGGLQHGTVERLIRVDARGALT
ncbi:DSD1 family PLP-dependent enzyme [Hydrogenophaga sp. OTU3427]|uniref:DSD1 family PLP-dependent enzyme n=1 Tax=Hydrogenophaga sp. OTU3427 TaxID=3043856 RepID=UPI00313D6F08